jgi:hypothetical protein
MSQSKRQFSVEMTEDRIAEVDGVAAEMVPPASRNSTINYLVGLGLAEYRKRQEDTAHAMEVLEMARGRVAAAS